MLTDLESFHGISAHGRLFTGGDMVSGSVLGAVVQKVPGPPLTFLPVDLTLVMVQRWLLSESSLSRQSREGEGPLRARVEARQTLGSTEDQSPPKIKSSSG